jgi:predicted N-acetyltransferase YhbS
MIAATRPISEMTPLARADAGDVERLLDIAFGTDRHKRTAYALRAGMLPIPALSFAAFERGVLIGSLQCWPIALTTPAGEAMPLILVGPVAVVPERQRSGIGRALMVTMLDAADATRAEPQVLIGDPEYYGRFFGFTAESTGGWELPGPVDRHRLLARTDGRLLPAHGMLGPRA